MDMAFHRGTQNTFDVFVANLPKDINEKTLSDLFSPFGAISKVQLKDSRQQNDDNKIGFVKFFTKADAEMAIRERGGHMWDGNGPLIVKWAVNRLKNASETLQSKQSSLPIEQSSDDGSVHSSSSGKTRNFNTQNFTKEILRVTYIEDSVTFWAKPEEDEKSYVDIIHRVLYEECGKMLPIKEMPIKNKMYATQFSEDGAWYRCKIMQQLDDVKCVVRYVDFGNSESVKINNIVDVPKKVMGVQSFAKRYRINKLEASDPMKLEKGKHFLGTKLYGKNLDCKIFRNGDEDLNYLEILNTELKNLTDELLMLKYATQKIRGKSTSSSSIVGSPPLIQGLLQERDAAKAEVLNLQSQLSSAQEQIHQLSTMLARNDFQAKITTVIDKVSEVELYRAQFQLDDDDKDPLLMADKLLSDNTRVLPQNLLLLPTAKRNIEKYEEMQSIICKCSKEELKSQVEARDAARLQLHGTLQKFIGEVVQLPLQERLHSLEEVIQKILMIYKKFLDIQSNGSLPPEVLREHYKNFKKKSESEVAEIRNETDSYQIECKNIFHQLQNALCVEDPVSGSAFRSCPDFINFLDKYNVVLEKELGYYKKKETNEKKFLGKVVQKLIEQLNQEKNYILSLLSTLEKYTNLEKELRPWLSQKPDLSSLNNLKKEIKKNKSKLRHLLANQQDLEEMEDDDDTLALNIEISKEEINSARQELHSKYALENEILKSLSHTLRTHFPELIIEFPEMEMKYKGVVKKRSLEEYSVEAIPSESTDALILKTEFNGKPKILKEFILHTSSSKDEFLQNINDYISIKSDNLIPVETVFFAKNERQVYVQMPFYERNLYQFLINSKVNNETRFEIIQDILKGVAALHSGGIVHGSIRPENVRIDQNGRALLAPYNFSLSLAQRRTGNLPPINNLTFLAPELLLQANSEPTMASDIFSLGCLILWIRQSKQSFILDENGIPDISLQFRPKEEDDFFSAVLTKDPQDRASAQELLSFPCGF